MKFFNFLYYKSYKLALILGNDDFYPEVNAWFLATSLPWLNSFSLLIILRDNSFLSNELFKFLLIGSSIFWVVTFFFCMQKKNHDKIMSSQKIIFNSERTGNILYLTYFLITCFIYFIYLSD